MITGRISGSEMLKKIAGHEAPTEGVIRIGINPNFPPMSSRNASGEWEGFDIDIGNKIAEALKVTVEWVPTETAQRVPFLVADQIDMSLGALTRNTERAKLIEKNELAKSRVMRNRRRLPRVRAAQRRAPNLHPDQRLLHRANHRRNRGHAA